MDGLYDITQLVDLLNPKDPNRSDSSDDEINEEERNSSQDLNPSQIKEKTKKKRPYDKVEEPEKNETVVDPEDDAQFYSPEDESVTNWKKCPEWDLTYRQQVTPSDVFLQMGGKTPATSSCEDMIISIEMPGEKFQNIDIKITKEKLDLTSPQYKLNIPLPHPVDAQRGNAKWDGENEKLIITLRMDREFDFVNF